jgi:hypothetical protein
VTQTTYKFVVQIIWNGALAVGALVAVTYFFRYLFS